MDNKQNALILNTNGGVVFQGKVKLTNIKRDRESGNLVADCRINKQTVLVWKIDGLWQGWTN